jgi:hypothetical protein
MPFNEKVNRSKSIMMVAVPIFTAVIFVLAFGNVFGEKLAHIFGIDPSLAIRGQPHSDVFMALLMLGLIFLLILGWIVGYAILYLINNLRGKGQSR